MSKPSLNRVSVIKCSEIRKSCRIASIIGVSSIVKPVGFVVVTQARQEAYMMPRQEGENTRTHRRNVQWEVTLANDRPGDSLNNFLPKYRPFQV